MKPAQVRRGFLTLVTLLTALTAGCASCSESQRPGAYGEQSANDAMLDYEREEEMRQSDL